MTSHTVNLLFILCPGWRKKGSLITEVADQRAFGFYSRTCPLLVCDGVNNNLFIVSDEGCMRTGRMKTESPHSLPHHWASCQGRYLDGEQLVLWICSLRLRLRIQGRAAGEVHRSDRSTHFFSVLLFDNNWDFLSPRES